MSAVIMELLRNKSNGVGFMPTLFSSQPTTIPTQLSIQILEYCLHDLPQRACVLLEAF